MTPWKEQASGQGAGGGAGKSRCHPTPSSRCPPGALLPRHPGPRSHQSGHQPAGGAQQAPQGRKGPQCGQTPNLGVRVSPGPPGLTTREKQAVGTPRPVTGGSGLAEHSFGREGGGFLGD